MVHYRTGSRYMIVLIGLVGLIALSCGAPARGQFVYDVSIDTTGLSGVAGTLAYDLTDGDGVANNTVLVTNFSSDATLSGATNTNTGGATGDLPGNLSLTDSAFFNESARGLTLANSITFRISLSNNYAAGGAPDEFALFLLNSAMTGPLVSTEDPTGANALFVFDMTGDQAAAPTVYGSLTQGVSYLVTPYSPPPPPGVPEPSAFAVIGAGLAMALPVLLRKRR